MGVRFGEKEWRDRVAGLIARDQKGIDQILLSYGVPLLDESGNLIRVAE